MVEEGSTTINGKRERYRQGIRWVYDSISKEAGRILGELRDVEDYNVDE